MAWRGRHRRRNIPLPTAADYAHAGWNPDTEERPRQRRDFTASGASGVLLGRVDELTVERRGGIIDATPARLRGLYLAWIPESNDLAVGTKSHQRPGRIDGRSLSVYRQFHDADPSRLTVFNIPESPRGMYRVGLVRSLTYVIPEGMRSSKEGARWVHLIGDHGEAGHGAMQGEREYPDRLKPMLWEDDNGRMFIERRPGNRYDVTKWIYW